MAENIISIEDLSKSFGDHEVLRKIDISVDKGEVICIVGSSGSGKSTLLRCINRLEHQTSGRILYHPGKTANSTHTLKIPPCRPPGPAFFFLVFLPIFIV